MDDDHGFFERERDRLTREITAVSHGASFGVVYLTMLEGFEELLSSANDLNRKLEEVLGMTKEYDTIAVLWHSFYKLMNAPAAEETSDDEELQGLPGTGTHIVAAKQSANRQP